MKRTPLILFAFFLAFILPAEGAPVGGKVPQKVEDRFLPEGDGVKVEGGLRIWKSRGLFYFFPMTEPL